MAPKIIKKPEVSVVMSVYNGANTLHRTIDSILCQQDVDLEFIIVNDGSTDGSNVILEQYASQDKRIRIISQHNQGLTKALIRGCAAAQGKYIARQDTRDISLPGRLRKQLDRFSSDSKAVLVSCGTRFIGPEQEHLYDIVQSDKDATEGLSASDPKHIRGPSHHGSAMFLRDAYEKVGGYRSEFYFAQDLDLWIRLNEIGSHITVPEVLYEAVVTPFDISRCHRKEQVALTGYMLECLHLRHAKKDEGHVLHKAAQIRPDCFLRANRLKQASGLYFIGACLKSRDDPRAQEYFRKAIKACPLHIRSWLRLAL